jgi:hypothetical protein
MRTSLSIGYARDMKEAEDKSEWVLVKERGASIPQCFPNIIALWHIKMITFKWNIG